MLAGIVQNGKTAAPQRLLKVSVGLLRSVKSSIQDRVRFPRYPMMLSLISPVSAPL